MKKIGILFIFFALIFGLVLLPECEAIEATDLKNVTGDELATDYWLEQINNAESELNDNGIKVIVRQEGQILATKSYNTADNENYNETDYIKERIVIDTNKKLAKNKEIEVFIFTEEDGLNIDDTNNKLTVSNISGRYEWGHYETEQQEAYEKIGNEGWIHLVKIKCSDARNYSFEFDAKGYDKGNKLSIQFIIQITFSIGEEEKLNFGYEVVDKIEGWEVEGEIAEAELDDGGIKVIVRQGKNTYVTKTYKDNVITYVEDIDIELPKKFAKDEEIDVFIYTEEEGLHTVLSSIGYTVSARKSPKVVSSDSSNETKVAFDKDGYPALMGLTKIKCKENGNYSFLFDITGHDVKDGEKAHKSVNFSIQINFTVSDSGNRKGTYIEAQYIDGKVEGWEKQEDEAENELDSGDFMILIQQNGIPLEKYQALNAGNSWTSMNDKGKYVDNGDTSCYNPGWKFYFESGGVENKHAHVNTALQVGKPIEIFVYSEEIGLLDLENFNTTNKHGQLRMSVISENGKVEGHYYKGEDGYEEFLDKNHSVKEDKEFKQVKNMAYQFHFNDSDNDSFTSLTTLSCWEPGAYSLVFSFECPHDGCIDFGFSLILENVVGEVSEYYKQQELAHQFWRDFTDSQVQLVANILDPIDNVPLRDPIIIYDGIISKENLGSTSAEGNIWAQIELNDLRSKKLCN